ncbi:transposase [Streptomyces sp. NPDC006475]|uniref:transposase n=1 Tax=Streptomyces sp. NPDC006475 TaxID=3155719 RepID=UPI0033AB21DE
MWLSVRLAVGLAVGKRQSRPWIVSDELWSLIESLLPEPAAKQIEGRPRVPDQQALCRILFVLHTGIQWEYLPQELGFGLGMTCSRRLAAWNDAGVWGTTACGAAEEAAGREEAGLFANGDRLLPRPGRSAEPNSGPSPVSRARPGGKHIPSSTGRASHSPSR